MEEKDLLQNSCGGFPYPVTTQGELESFSCGDKDLDDFFHQDAFLYAEQLLGKTYYFSTTGDDKKIVCAFTLANDSIKAALSLLLMLTIMTMCFIFMKRMASNSCTLLRVWRKRRIIFLKMSA